MGAYFGGGIIFWSSCTLSADPQLLCIFSWLLLALLVATPRNWLNASVVRFTRTFSEPIRRKPRSFSTCSTNHRVTVVAILPHTPLPFLYPTFLSLRQRMLSRERVSLIDTAKSNANRGIQRQGFCSSV